MKKFSSLLFISLLSILPVRGQDDEKIKTLFQQAISAMGGDTYLKVTSIVSEGHYFFYDFDGNSSSLNKYNDYTRLPDKSRFELGNSRKDREIEVFNLEKNEGWKVEGRKGTRDATPEEMDRFKNSAKHNLNNMLLFRYKDPQNKLFYLGPGEGPDVILETVRLVDPENDETTIYFNRSTKLPAKIEYRTLNKRGVRQRNVDEFSQWLVIEGVNTPLRIEGFINGRRSYQDSVLKVTYNNNLPDSFFSKPVPLK